LSLGSNTRRRAGAAVKPATAQTRLLRTSILWMGLSPRILALNGAVLREDSDMAARESLISSAAPQRE
jgi:hypothetical protein